MNKREITGFHLKMIALITMLIDHTAATLVETAAYGYPYGYYGWVNDGNAMVWRSIYQVMRGIGRMAFPLYCFLLVEGFLHTRSVKKYLLRLLGFAILSEIPFDMCFRINYVERDSFFSIFRGKEEPWNWLRWMLSYNNVYVTLFLGLLTLWAITKFQNKGKWVTPVIMIIGMFLAGFVFRSDYGAAGVLAICVLYLFRNDRKRAFLWAVAVLTILAGWTECFAVLMLLPLRYYNGTRGRQVKYVFYGFYPVHLMILACICVMIGFR